TGAVADTRQEISNGIGNSTHEKSGGLRDGLPRPVAERHSQFAQERFGFLVRSCTGDNSNIKSNVALNFIELDFGKNRLIRNSQRIIAVLIETARRHTAKIANAG